MKRDMWLVADTVLWPNDRRPYRAPDGDFSGLTDRLIWESR